MFSPRALVLFLLICRSLMDFLEYQSVNHFRCQTRNRNLLFEVNASLNEIYFQVIFNAIQQKRVRNVCQFLIWPCWNTKEAEGA